MVSSQPASGMGVGHVFHLEDKGVCGKGSHKLVLPEPLCKQWEPPGSPHKLLYTSPPLPIPTVIQGVPQALAHISSWGSACLQSLTHDTSSRQPPELSSPFSGSPQQGQL